MSTTYALDKPFSFNEKTSFWGALVASLPPLFLHVSYLDKGNDFSSSGWYTAAAILMVCIGPLAIYTFWSGLFRVAGLVIALFDPKGWSFIPRDFLFPLSGFTVFIFALYLVFYRGPF